MRRGGRTDVIVTLLSDFGTDDYFVAAMKGVILSHHAGITIVDITHTVPRHDVETGAFLLDACYRDFPGGTVHLAVVDPGVGSDRRPLAGQIGEHRFVAPDNGVLSHVLRRGEEPQLRVIDERFRRSTPSSTFHGRDLFAPLAAAMAAGLPLQDVGPSIDDPVTLPLPLLPPDGAGKVAGRILHVDRFGNCVTSFPTTVLTRPGWRFVIAAPGREINRLVSHYAVGEAGEPLLIPGSAGYLEISINEGSAAQMLGLRTGDPISLTWER